MFLKQQPSLSRSTTLSRSSDAQSLSDKVCLFGLNFSFVYLKSLNDTPSILNFSVPEIGVSSNPPPAPNTAPLFKKGFLTAPKKESPSSASLPTIVCLKKPATDSHANLLDGLKSVAQTPPLDEKLIGEFVKTHETLLQDPEYEKFIQLMSHNPREALTQYAHRSDFMQSLLPLVNNATGALPQAQAKSVKSVQMPVVFQDEDMRPMLSMPTDLPSHEKELLVRIKKSPDAQVLLHHPLQHLLIVKAALRDPNVQKLIANMKNNRAAHNHLASIPPLLRKKVRALVDVGLISFVS